MENIIKLEDIIEGLEFQSSEMRAFLNLRNGEVITVTDEELRSAEDGESMEELLEEDYFISLPSQFDINEYSIMEEYCLEMQDDDIRETLYSSIKGSGAFRRFKDKIRKYGIEEEWHKYRDEVIKRIAVEWCEENGISYK